MTTPLQLNPITTLDALQREGMLSVRSYNCLKYAGLITIGDLVKYVRTGKELRDIPKMGRGSELEIKKLLTHCTTYTAPVPDKTVAKYFEDLDEELKEVLKQAFDKLIKSPSTQSSQTINHTPPYNLNPPNSSSTSDITPYIPDTTSNTPSTKTTTPGTPNNPYTPNTTPDTTNSPNESTTTHSSTNTLNINGINSDPTIIPFPSNTLGSSKAPNIKRTTPDSITVTFPSNTPGSSNTLNIKRPTPDTTIIPFPSNTLGTSKTPNIKRPTPEGNVTPNPTSTTSDRTNNPSSPNTPPIPNIASDTPNSLVNPTPQSSYDITNYINLIYPDIRSCYFDLTKGKDKILKIQPYLTVSENIAFRRWHIDLLEEALRLMYDNPRMVANPMYRWFLGLKEELEYNYRNFSCTEIVEKYVNEKTDKLLQKSYETLSRERLNTRAFNFVQSSLPSYRDAVGYFGKSVEEYTRLCPGRSMGKTLSDIHAFVQEFQQLEFGSYERFLDTGDTLLDNLRKEYPYLNLLECLFVRDFILRHKVRPIFFLINRSIRISKRKEPMCFCLYHGLNEEEKKYTRAEIAAKFPKYHWDTIQVEKFIKDRSSILLDLRITFEERRYYKHLFATSPTPNLITEDSELFKTITSEEHLPEDDFDLFCTLCSLIEYIPHYVIYEDLGFKALIEPSFKYAINDWRYRKKFQKVFSARYAKRTFFHYSEFGPYITSEFYKDAAYLFSIMTKGSPNANNIVFAKYGLYIGEDRLDIAAELYKILEETGKPLTLQEWFDCFKERHPDHHYYNPTQIRPYLSKLKGQIKQVKNIGKFGKETKYGLASWEHVYFGDLRSLLIETLEKIDLPMHINELFQIVAQNFPDADIEMVSSTMLNNNRNNSSKANKATKADNDQVEFVRFEDGYYGLSDHEYPPTYIKFGEGDVFHTSVRRSISEWLKMLDMFIQNNHHFPFVSKDAQENALYCWLHGATLGQRGMTEDEKIRLKELIEKYDDAGYPHTAMEQAYQMRCQEYKQYVEEHHSLPTYKSDSKLYYWFKSNRSNYINYKDKRCDYFKELCDYLKSQGYRVDV